MRVFKGIILSFFLSSCAVGPNYRSPDYVMPHAFVEDQEKEESSPALLASWWSSFNDPLLDVLIHEAIEQNLDLQIALEKIAETRALHHLQAAELFPKIDLSVEQRRSRISETLFESPFLGPTTQDFYRLGFDASWEIDIFGKLRRAKEAALYDYEAQIESARDVYITLLSEIAIEYIQIRSFQNQIAFKEKNIFVQAEILELTESLFEAGLASAIHVAQAKERLEEEESLLPPLKEELNQGIFRLAVLMGKTPESFSSEFVERKPIPTSLAPVPVGLPSELLRRRPDIREAERMLARATASTGAAIAELFPSISILGSYGYQTTQNGEWLKPKSRFWRIGPSLNWPILYFGRLRANIHAKTSQQEQALLNYEQTVLQALEDVESSLTAYKQEQKKLSALTLKLDAATKRYILERDRYISGLIDFSTLLNADQDRIRIENEKVTSMEKVSTNLVALYKSLGGDWLSYASH